MPTPRKPAGQYSSATSKKYSLAQQARRAAMSPLALENFREVRRAWHQRKKLQRTLQAERKRSR